MVKSAIFVATIVLLATPSTARAQRARVPVHIQFGWETTCNPLGSVPAESKIHEDFEEKNVEVGFVYYQYWLILPFWTSGGSFALYGAVEPPQNPEVFWVMKEQDPVKLAELIGIPQDRFKKPFFYRIPFGWLVIVGAVVLVKLTSGPSAKTRFSRLWNDHRFRAAVASILGDKGQDLPDEFDAILLKEPPSEARFDEEVQRLEELGVPRRKAIRDLEFMMLYLVENGKLALVEPPQDSASAEESREESPPT